MNLKEFVSESLSQIVSGVIDAQEILMETEAIIVPEMSRSINTASIGEAKNKPGQPVAEVEFDILVTVSEKKESGMSLSVALGTINGSGKGGRNTDYGENSRIKFKIPIVMPINTYVEKRKK